MKFIIPFLFSFLLTLPSHSISKYETWKCWVTGKCSYNLCGSNKKIDTYPADWRYTQISSDIEPDKKET
jgi:hypothetical protein